ncbi:protein CEBPZOS isoform X3 [Hyla sarda]|uniref:protein CEBPZOS isoform X2 n=1 Tax=Hyla sarda TaxID=327740 RepID=UPI0024C2C13B|nr:protein CEBPZOS isoform X2 [Hyla sarda]XP_056423400.1 protein CEBPZOS isoform X3 [Hyla sarda]
MVKVTSKLFKGVLALELAGVVGAYLLYFRMDSSQDFRHTMNRRFPSVLEVYYKSNEWSGIQGIRERDALAWELRKN